LQNKFNNVNRLQHRVWASIHKIDGGVLMLQMHLQLGLEYCKKLLFTNKKRKPNEAKTHKKVKGTCAVSRNRTELNWTPVKLELGNCLCRSTICFHPSGAAMVWYGIGIPTCLRMGMKWGGTGLPCDVAQMNCIGSWQTARRPPQ